MVGDFMADGFFKKRKKKKLIKDLLEKRKSFNIVDYNNDIDFEFLYNYDYSILLKLKQEDLIFKSVLQIVLESLILVGKRLDNIPFDRIYPKIKKYLITKEDYVRLDELCKKYDIFELETILVKTNCNSFSQLTDSVIENYYNDKAQYEDEHNKNSIQQILNENNVPMPHFEIKTKTDAETYVKMYSFFNKHELNSFHMTFGNLINDFDFFKPIFSILDISNLSLEDTEKLIDYMFLRTSYINNIPQINTIEQLNNYNNTKRIFLENNIKNNKDILYILLYILPAKKYIFASDLLYKLNNLDRILEDEKVLNNECKVSKNELDFLTFIKKLKNNENDVLKNLEYQNKIFKDIDFKYLRVKMRLYYSKKIANSLTKLSSNPNIKKIDNTEGVETYELSGGEFMFLQHAIVCDPPNTRIHTLNNGKNNYDNPELWDEMDISIGTQALSTSLISQNGFCLYGGSRAVFYGFDELIPSSVQNICPGDGATPHGENQENFTSQKENLYLPDELIEQTHKSSDKYNEVAFNRYANGTRIKPNFIICYDYIDEVSIKHAQYHQVPILVIKTQKYLDIFYDNVKKKIKELESCDKSNLEKYYNCLDSLIIAINKYNRIPWREQTKRIKIDVDMKELKKERLNIKYKLENYQPITEQSSLEEEISLKTT